MRVLVIGLTRELPLSPADALDIADKLVARAANAHTEGNTVRKRTIYNMRSAHNCLVARVLEGGTNRHTLKFQVGRL